MASVLQVRVDDDLKAQATMVYEQLGIDLSTAVRIFLKKSIAVNGIPFDVKNSSSAEKAIAAANRMRETSERNGTADMTLEDVNDIIRKTRLERKSIT